MTFSLAKFCFTVLSLWHGNEYALMGHKIQFEGVSQQGSVIIMSLFYSAVDVLSCSGILLWDDNSG
jgi:hypothetical protein